MIKRLFNLFSRLSKRERLVLYAASFFIALVLLDRLVMGPILFKIKSLNQEIQSQKSFIKRNLHILAQKERIRKEVNIYASYVTAAQSQEEETVFLLKEIEEIANESSVYVIDIKSAGFEKEGILKKYLVKINCEAQMEQLIHFFYDVESSNKLLQIEKYDMRPKTEGSSVLRCALSISQVVMP